MAWAVTAVTAVVAIASYSSARSSRHQAEATATRQDEVVQEQNRISQQNIDFQREQYDRWKDIYGDLQEDLGTYFTNLTGDKKLGMELNNIEEQKQIALNNANTTMAQRGLDRSGASVQANQDINFSANRASNEARNTADDRVREERLRFLSQGMGQNISLANNVSNASNSQSRLLGQQSATIGQQGRTQLGILNQRNNALGEVAGYGTSLLTQGLSSRSGTNPTTSQYDLYQAEQQGNF